MLEPTWQHNGFPAISEAKDPSSVPPAPTRVKRTTKHEGSPHFRLDERALLICLLPAKGPQACLG